MCMPSALRPAAPEFAHIHIRQILHAHVTTITYPNFCEEISILTIEAINKYPNQLSVCPVIHNNNKVIISQALKEIPVNFYRDVHN